MRHTPSLCGVLLLAAGSAQAGGIDRSGQPIGILFEKGNYVELSFGEIHPSVSGTDLTPYATASGGVAGDHTLPGLALKYQINDKLSAARDFGATDTLRADMKGLRKAVLALTEGQGADHVLVAVGAIAAYAQASALAPSVRLPKAATDAA